MSIGIKRLIIPHYLLKADINPLETSPCTNSPLLALELEDTSLAEYRPTLITTAFCRTGKRLSNGILWVLLGC